MRSLSGPMLRVLVLGCSILAVHRTIYCQVAPSIAWQGTYGGSHDEIGRDIVRTADNGFVVSGFTTSVDGDVSGQNGDHDMWIFKIDSAGTLQWQQTLGGISWDDAYDLAQAADGGYFLAGFITPYPVLYNQAAVIKLDTSGNVLWSVNLGGTGNDLFRCVEGTADGGCILIGRTDSNDGDVSGNHGADDAWVVKLDSTGAPQWQHCYGGSLAEVGWSITSTKNGGYLFTASTLSADGDVAMNAGGNDVWLVALDNSGMIQWEKSFGGSWSETPFDLALTLDGGCVIAARTSSNDGDVSGLHGNEDAWVVKVDSMADLQWQRCFGGSLFDTPVDIDQLDDGGFIFTGNTRSIDGDVTGNHGWSDAWVVRLDASGNLLWQKAMGGSDWDGGSSVVALPNGHFMMTGYVQSADGDVQDFIGVRDVWLVELGEEDLITGEPSTHAVSKPSVVPNPTQGQMIIVGDLSANSDYAVINTLGSVVLAGRLQGSGSIVELGALPAGPYVLRGSSPYGPFSVRLVKE
ncbi:MAG: T9SS type A sorting domain-containing protein [Flavobacteriales bacterium]|nr:MAG: T9SS type A sorting domain-containing protein [Flavobacteriales bacterium]